MNRHDLVQAKARDIASNIHADPVARDRLADDLIDLIGQMLAGVGKYVAIKGESAMNEACEDECSHVECDLAEARTLYAAGERIQDATRAMVKDCQNPGVNLERWRKTDPGTPCECGHEKIGHSSFDLGPVRCLNCRCTAYTAVGGQPTGGWVHEDRRPEGLKLADETAATPIVLVSEGQIDLALPTSSDPWGSICPPLPGNLSPAHETKRIPFRINGAGPIERYHDGAAFECCEICHRVLPRTTRPTLPRRDPGATLRCNCCAGPCRNDSPAPGPEQCCFPLGDVCPNHC